jgi:hypothetical protein
MQLIYKISPRLCLEAVLCFSTTFLAQLAILSLWYLDDQCRSLVSEVLNLRVPAPHELFS